MKTTIPDTQATTGRPALTALSLSVLLASFGSGSASVALPELARTLGVSFQAVQWVVITYLLAVTTLIVSVGRLGDSLGRRRLLLAGIVVFSAASLLCGLANDLWLLLAARALQGLGAAAMLAMTMALVGETVAPERTGRAIGLLGTMSATGTALGPSLGGLLLAGFGWPAIFLINLPLGAIAWLLTVRSLPVALVGTARLPAGFDLRGTLLLVVTLAAYALALTPGRAGFGGIQLALLLLAALGAAAFVGAEARATVPLIRVATLVDPRLSASLAASLLVAAVMMATLVVGPFYLAGALGLGASVVGLVLAVGPAAAAFTAVPAGRLTDRFGVRRVTILGLLGMSAAALALSFLPASFGIAGYLAPLVVLTVSYAFFQTANNTAVMMVADPEQRGAVSGLLNLSRNLGLISGAALMGSVFVSASAVPDIVTASPVALASGMHATFAVAVGLIFSALVAVTRTAGRLPQG